MKKDDEILVIMANNIIIEGKIERTDSGHPVYNKDSYKISGFGDPVSTDLIVSLIHKEIEPLRSLAMNAYRNVSFSPEKRGATILKDYSRELYEDLATIEHHKGDVERYKSKYISFLSTWLSAQGRCFSVMITGAGNFPVRRHEKANN